MLQQSAAFRPFVGEFCAFTVIAMWTGKNNIFRAIRTAVGNWDNVIDMIGFAYLFAAIITTSFLTLILSFDILISMYTCGSAFSRTITMSIRINGILVGLSVFLSFFFSAFRMFYIPFSCSPFYLISIVCIMFIPYFLPSERPSLADRYIISQEMHCVTT